MNTRKNELSESAGAGGVPAHLLRAAIARWGFEVIYWKKTAFLEASVNLVSIAVFLFWFVCGITSIMKIGNNSKSLSTELEIIF